MGARSNHQRGNQQRDTPPAIPAWSLHIKDCQRKSNEFRQPGVQCRAVPRPTARLT
jgi:hypothetical protein